jgi:hypothetical protein
VLGIVVDRRFEVCFLIFPWPSSFLWNRSFALTGDKMYQHSKQFECSLGYRSYSDSKFWGHQSSNLLHHIVFLAGGILESVVVDTYLFVFLCSRVMLLFVVGQMFVVDIGGPTYASLPMLAFEGATRRNTPNLQVGAALYARVVKAHRDIDPELCCTDASGKAAGFGPLNGGYIFECSTGLARVLLSKPTCPVLEALGKSLSFEIAVGMNGRVWVICTHHLEMCYCL